MKVLKKGSILHMMKKNPESIFKTYFPENAVHYCIHLWNTYKFFFKIKRARSTKLGDYTYHFVEKKHVITVNADLYPEAFLITYLHEVAHMMVRLKHGNKKVQPHGNEWKQAFADIARPMLNESVFSSAVLYAFKNYLKNPKATSCSDKNLYIALNMPDTQNGKLMLQDLKEGNPFELNNRLFKKECTRRTRVLCEDLKTGKKYLISKTALVSVSQIKVA